MNGTMTAPVRYLGRWTLGAVHSLGMAGYLAAGAARALRNVEIWGPRLMPELVAVGVASVPIALFIATFTGIVLALQASYTFTGAVPMYFVGTLVGKTIIMELGPVLTGLSLAGRVGASISAEIGTMRVTEQIDALETLAYDPLAYLVVPRVLAGVLMFPIVVVMASAMGIVAGWAASMALLDMSSAEFVKGLKLFFEPLGRAVRRNQEHELRPHRHGGGFILRIPYEGWSRGCRHCGHALRRCGEHADPRARCFLGHGAALSIRLNDVHKAFGEKKILQGFSLDVRDGETVSIIGSSGAGKSVTLKQIIGLVQPDRGEVWIDDQNVCQLEGDELTQLRRRVGYVFQFAALLDSMTIADNVAMGLRRIPDMYEEEISSRVRECLSMVDLQGVEARYPSELSGGMVKRAGLARAIAMRPKYLLYDEPTTGLDPITVTRIDRLIMRMSEELGVTGIVVTHDMASAYRISDRIAMLYEGRIRTSGTVDEIQNTDDPLVRAFIEGRPELVEETE